MLAGSEDVTAWLWNADTAACMAVLSGHSGAVTCGDFTPDGRSCLCFRTSYHHPVRRLFIDRC